MEDIMKYEVTYSVKGFLNCFRDVGEVQNIDDCKAGVKYSGNEQISDV
jgi:hypothetical protein